MYLQDSVVPLNIHPFVPARENTILQWAFKSNSTANSRNVAFERPYSKS